MNSRNAHSLDHDVGRARDCDRFAFVRGGDDELYVVAARGIYDPATE
jgi:hypothetical protein